MSPDAVVGVYLALAVGVLAVLGVLAVVFVERYFRGRGKVRCVMYDCDLAVMEVGSLGYQAVFSFELYLFNDTPSATSLRRPSVAFLRDDAREVATGRLRDSASDEDLKVLELMPRQGVHLSLYAVFEGEEARELSDFRQVDFVGRLPDGEMFEQRIAGRGDFVAERKMVGVRRKHFAASRKKTPISRMDFVAGWKKTPIGRKDYARPWWRRPFGSSSAWSGPR